MSVPDNLRSTHSEKTKNAMKAPRSVKRITFNPSEANPVDDFKAERGQICPFDFFFALSFLY